MIGRLVRAGLVLLAVCAGRAVADDAPLRLDVASHPEGAQVFVDGVLKGSTPVSVFGLEPGTRFVRVTAPGHEPAEAFVALAAGAFVRKDFELTPQTGLLLVKTEPAGADVRSEGVSLGTTPLFIDTLRTDRTHTLELSRPGYRSKTVDVVLKGRTPVVREESLMLDSGIIECKSVPEGAEVTVNGVARGVAPVTVSGVPKGLVTVTFAKVGYESATRELRIAPGDRQVLAVTLDAVPCVYRIVSNPEGARVFLDDEYKGKAPLVLNGVRPGVHVARVELAGYGTMARTLTAKNGDDKTEEFVMQSVLGVLEIVTAPPGARISIDGRVVGTTSSTTKDAVKSDILCLPGIEEGEHRIVAHLRGYADASGKVKVEARKTRRRTLRLKRVFSPDTEIETITGVYRGVLVTGGAKAGSLKLEIREGIVQEFRQADIRKISPIVQP